MLAITLTKETSVSLTDKAAQPTSTNGRASRLLLIFVPYDPVSEEVMQYLDAKGVNYSDVGLQGNEHSPLDLPRLVTDNGTIVGLDAIRAHFGNTTSTK